MVQPPRIKTKIKPTKPNKTMRLKQIKAAWPGRKKTRRPTKRGENTKKIILQLQEVTLSLPLKRRERTLAKLLASTKIKRAITQKILFNLSKKLSCSLDNDYGNDC